MNSLNDQYQKIKDYYNHQAKADPSSAGVLDVRSDIERLYRESEEWNHFRAIVPLEQTMNVLELGCGAGRWCFNMAPFVHHAHGVDISEEAILLAKQKNERLGITNVSFEVNDLRSFRTGIKYDLIYFSGVLLYVDDHDLPQVVRAYVTILSAAGLVAVRDTCMTRERLFCEYPYSAQYGPCPVTYRKRDEYIGLFRECGYALSYCAPSYLHLRPSFLGRLPFIRTIYEQAPEKTLKVLKYAATGYNLVIPQTSRRINDFSHEFQIYRREQK